MTRFTTVFALALALASQAHAGPLAKLLEEKAGLSSDEAQAVETTVTVLQGSHKAGNARGPSGPLGELLANIDVAAVGGVAVYLDSEQKKLLRIAQKLDGPERAQLEETVVKIGRLKEQWVGAAERAGALGTDGYGDLDDNTPEDITGTEDPPEDEVVESDPPEDPPTSEDVAPPPTPALPAPDPFDAIEDYVNALIDATEDLLNAYDDLAEAESALANATGENQWYTDHGMKAPNRPPKMHDLERAVSLAAAAVERAESALEELAEQSVPGNQTADETPTEEPTSALPTDGIRVAGALGAQVPLAMGWGMTTASGDVTVPLSDNLAVVAGVEAGTCPGGKAALVPVGVEVSVNLGWAAETYVRLRGGYAGHFSSSWTNHGFLVMPQAGIRTDLPASPLQIAFEPSVAATFGRSDSLTARGQVVLSSTF